jgi:glycogen debranching enzyme
MKKTAILLLAALPTIASVRTHAQTPAFPLTEKGLVISRPTQPPQPFTVAGQSGILVGTQDGQFESWINPIKFISHLTIEANLKDYTVPIPVNPQSANIEVRPDHTTITYSHPGFTIRQIMFSLDQEARVPPAPNLGPGNLPMTGPVVLFQIDSIRPLDLTFRFTPEMRWMWPRRSDGVPSPDWIPDHPVTDPNVAEAPQPDGPGFYVLGGDYPGLLGAITIPTATPGILAPYQERPQVHPLELHLHYDPARDAGKYFPLLMAVATSHESANTVALHKALLDLESSLPEAYKAHAAQYAKLEADSTSIQTPDKSLDEAFQWGIVSIEQLRARVPAFPASASQTSPTPVPQSLSPSSETALVAGYFASGDSARPGFGWFFGRDSLYTLYATNSYGDFALTRAELEFLIARQREDGKIMHEYSQTAADPSVDWKSFGYMYAAADATPLFLMAVRDYYRASGDKAFLESHKDAIEKAWAFETAASSDTDHDGIYDNSQGTGWVESWPGGMPHQEVYMALLDKQASLAYADLAAALNNTSASSAASARATKIATTIEQEYYDPAKGCYAFATNPPLPSSPGGKPEPNGPRDNSVTIYPAIAWWDYNNTSPASASQTNGGGKDKSPILAHPETCLSNFASPEIDTDWGTRDLANTSPFYDGLSYHQGSVWPLFTGWGALAEYRANQPLAGQQLLMQNVDLTWAQDPGAVTELLSGDFFVPFGRSTSHQLWSSAAVITPTLRGLFGINLNSGTNTITVNPNLPANWMRISNRPQDNPQISNLHIGDQKVTLLFYREGQKLQVELRDVDKSKQTIQLRSDLPGAQTISKPRFAAAQISIPLPPIELVLPDSELPTPGSRTSQIKVLATTYSAKALTVKLAVPAETDEILRFERNQPVSPHLSVQSTGSSKVEQAEFGSLDKIAGLEPAYVRITAPKGQGYQTLEFTLTW